MAHRPQGVRGATLAELVVAILIISVLVTLGGAVAQRVRVAALRTACHSNLRQAGMAFLAYGQDWSALFPAERVPGGLSAARSPAWFDRLPAYLDQDERTSGSVLQCAAWRPTHATVMAHASPKSLKMNSYLDDDGRPLHYRQGRERREGDVVLLVDAVAGETGMGQWGHCLRSAATDLRHPGHINAVALDGHGLWWKSTAAELYWLGHEVP